MLSRVMYTYITELRISILDSTVPYTYPLCILYLNTYICVADSEVLPPSLCDGVHTSLKRTETPFIIFWEGRALLAEAFSHEVLWHQRDYCRSDITGYSHWTLTSVSLNVRLQSRWCQTGDLIGHRPGVVHADRYIVVDLLGWFTKPMGLVIYQTIWDNFQSTLAFWLNHSKSQGDPKWYQKSVAPRTPT